MCCNMFSIAISSNHINSPVDPSRIYGVNHNKMAVIFKNLFMAVKQYYITYSYHYIMNMHVCKSNISKCMSKKRGQKHITIFYMNLQKMQNSSEIRKSPPHMYDTRKIIRIFTIKGEKVIKMLVILANFYD